jgi:hypothetical protein
MKLQIQNMRTWFVLLLLLCPALVSPAPVQDEHREFRDKFKQAMSINAKDEMARLVRTNKPLAVKYVIDIAEATAQAPSEPVFEQIEALRLAWKASMKTDFVTIMERYFASLDSSEIKERMRFRNQYDKKAKIYNNNLTDKDGPKFAILALDFEGLAHSFEGIGDKYFASQCWSYYGLCNDEGQRGKAADLKLCTKGFGHCVRLRDELQLKDTLYEQTQPRHAWLVANGYGPKEGGGESGEGGGGANPVESANSIPIAMGFEMVTDIGKYQRPSYFDDVVYPVWNVIAMQAKGSSVDFPRIEGTRVYRPTASGAMIDTDGDGEGDVAIPVKGKITPVLFTIGQASDKREYAILARAGIPTDTYQSLQVNLAPDDNQLNIYYTCASSMVGELEGTPIRILDDNLDGVYGSLPATYGHMGMSENHFQPELDSIVIGKEKRARPWSEYIQVGGQWYRLEVEAHGKSVAATPATLKTGKIKLKYKGAKANWLVLQGEGSYENSFFDISGGKAIDVPIGRYQLVFGDVRKGKGLQTMKALIVAGKGTPSWRVEAGETTTVELGAPFDMEFKFDKNGDEATVTGTSVVITGRAGERYERIWNAVPRPEASYRKAGTKKGSKGKKMRIISSQDDLGVVGWRGAWSPLDITIPTTGDKIEMQLFVKKNKLFGKITSSWKD